MMKFEDLSIGQTVYTQIDGEWTEGRVTTLIGNRPPNEGRTLVEVRSILYGIEIFEVEDLYPAPDIHSTYMMADVVERIPDNRVYEFGIGNINNDDDPYYTDIQQTKPTGKRRMIILGRCGGCGGEFPREHLMNASRGTACPDCYDRMSN